MPEGAKIIWILFGDMSGFEPDIGKLKSAYQYHNSVVTDHGYTLGIPDYLQSKQTFLNLIGDTATHGFVWHSHGVYDSHGEPRGFLADKDQQSIKPGDLVRKSPNMEFAALFGCAIAKDTTTYDAWKRACGLQGFQGATGRFESRLRADVIRTWFWGGRYGGESTRFAMKPGAQEFAQFEFPRWVEKL